MLSAFIAYLKNACINFTGFFVGKSGCYKGTKNTVKIMKIEALIKTNLIKPCLYEFVLLTGSFRQFKLWFWVFMWNDRLHKSSMLWLKKRSNFKNIKNWKLIEKKLNACAISMISKQEIKLKHTCLNFCLNTRMSKVITKSGTCDKK